MMFPHVTMSALLKAISPKCPVKVPLSIVPQSMSSGLVISSSQSRYSHAVLSQVICQKNKK